MGNQNESGLYDRPRVSQTLEIWSWSTHNIILMRIVSKPVFVTTLIGLLIHLACIKRNISYTLIST